MNKSLNLNLPSQNEDRSLLPSQEKSQAQVFPTEITS